MKGFTLIEVELSLLVFSMGALAMIGLYPLGFRESMAARDDLRAVAASESIMSRVVSALSDTNLTWRVWKEVAGSGDVSRLPGGAEMLAEVPSGWRSRVLLTADEPSRVGISVSVAPRVAALKSAPRFYSEVRFQGRPE